MSGTFYPNEVTKLSPAEKGYLKVYYCKVCGKKIPFLSRSRSFCPKCKPSYPSDKYWRGKSKKI